MNLFLIIVIFIIMIRLGIIKFWYFKQIKNHYEVLGLKKGVSDEQIKKRYY